MRDHEDQSGSAVGQTPAPFKLQRVADFGTSEPWVARIELGLPEVAGMAIPDRERREAFNDAWPHVGTKLGEAFVALVEVRRLDADPEAPLLDRSRAYNSLYSSLWAAYKDRWRTAMRTINFDMGFLFVNESNFEARFKSFAESHSSLDVGSLKEMALADQTTWQKKFVDYRNHEIEHRTGEQDVAFFENLHSAEASFYNTWRTIEDWTIRALQEFVKPPLHIYEVPKADRDPAIPKKYVAGIDQSELKLPSR